MIPIEKQVITLEQAKRLKELGVEQDSLFYWVKRCNGEGFSVMYKVFVWSDDVIERYSAFTIGELQSMIYEDVSVKDSFEDIEYFITTYGDIERFNRIIKG